MAITRNDQLKDNDRVFTLTINSYDKKQLNGQITKEGQDQTLQFYGLMDLGDIIEMLLNSSNYPMKTTIQRRFSKTQENLDAEPVSDTVRLKEHSADSYKQEDSGRLATFRLEVKFRYYASWQGNITWLEGDVSRQYYSFIEMVSMICSVLDGKTMINPTAHLKVSQIIALTCSSHTKLKHTLAAAEEPDTVQAQEQFHPQMAENMYCMTGAGITFLIKILFTENHTCQGVIYWKEEREYINFRSFLEMILLIRDVMNESENESMITHRK